MRCVALRRVISITHYLKGHPTRFTQANRIMIRIESLDVGMPTHDNRLSSSNANHSQSLLNSFLHNS